MTSIKNDNTVPLEISNDDAPQARPSKAQAEEAVRTLIRYLGEDPTREGLLETPSRVVKSYDEFFAGYGQSAEEVLNKSFAEVDYSDYVLVKNIDFMAHCEHHMVPVVGKVHIAYWPDQQVVGLSKLARLVDVYAKRLITQEQMTTNIASALDKELKGKGSAVVVSAIHHCMSFRGICKPDSTTMTSSFTGIFAEDENIKNRFLRNIEA